MANSALTFAVALSIAFLLTPVARFLALRLGFVDKPNARKIHLSPTPLLGGVAIYLAVVMGLLLSVTQESFGQVVAVVAGATFLLLVGIVDDYVSLNSRLKLVVAIPFAGLILAVGGFRITAFPLSNWLAGWPEAALIVSFLLTILWVVVVTTAFTILDHMDGLCAGLAAVASAFFLFFAIVEGQFLVGILAAAMLGANLGFLKWNFKPASIFMGDGGALLIGFIMAALSIALRFTELTTLTSWMIPVLVLGVPLFDTSLVVVSRARRGLTPSKAPGKDHTAHRLANLGLGDSGAVVSMYVGGALFGGLAVLVKSLSLAQSYVMVGTIALLGIIAVVLMERAPYERQKTPKSEIEPSAANVSP